MSDAHETAPEQRDQIALALKSLKGDTRDFLLDRLKHDHSALPWHLRGEAEQMRTIEQADAYAPLRHALIDATGKECLLVLVDSDIVHGDRGMPTATKDQGSLFPGDDDDADDNDSAVFDNTPSGRKR